MPRSQAPSVDFAIRNDVAELAIVTDALDRIGEGAAVPGRIVTQLQVALDELLSNIIRYAWPEGGSHELHVHIGVQLGEIQVVIVDDGKPFDPRGEAGPASPQPGREPRAGGLGIHMVKQLVDRLDYARIDGRNRVTLVKQYTAEAAPCQDRRQ